MNLKKNKVSCFQDKDGSYIAMIETPFLYAKGTSFDEAISNLKNKYGEYEIFCKNNEINLNNNNYNRITKGFYFLLKRVFYNLVSILFISFIIYFFVKSFFNSFLDKTYSFFKIDESIIIERLSRKLHHMAKKENTIDEKLDGEILENLKIIRKKYKKYFDALSQD